MIRVLVADDEALEREAMLHILANVEVDEPVQVKEAINGLEALRAAQAERPDIAFLDIRMPGMDGLGVAEQFSLLLTPPVVIMVSAYDYFAYARTALRFGVLDYLLKPASAEDVYRAFRRALREVARKKEEESRHSAAQTIAADLEESIKVNICNDLRAGRVDDGDIQRLVGFRPEVEGWSCIAIVTGEGRSVASDFSPIASHEFSRFVHALAERFLIADLGLTEYAPLLFIASSGQDAAKEEAARVHWPIMNVLLVIPHTGQRPLADESRSFFDVWCQQEQIDSRIGRFYQRCKEANGATSFRFGIGIEKVGNAKIALHTARMAFSLSNAERPILLLNSAHEIHQSPTSSPNSLSALAIIWLQDHFMESIGIWDLARELRASPSHLSRVLNKEIGIGFGETLARIRIARAKDLLANGISAREASSLVGFRDQSYFTKVFMKIEEISPSQYAGQFQTSR
jgi:two-component system response regulator YesN